MFQNKVVIVTGATSDIGQTVAIKFAKENASVVLVGRNEEKLAKVKKLCDDEGSCAFIVKADLTEDEDAENVIKQTIEKYKKLDVLVNNASILRLGNILEATILETFDDIMDTNVRAVMALTSYATEHLIASKGNIVNVSSIGGSRVVSLHHAAYCMSHAALNHFTKFAAFELGKEGVRVNSVSPAVLDEHESVLSTLLDEDPSSEDIADMVIYLASDDAKSITGSNYTCDSGALAKS
ncbi:uncharacterized oxidoreductase TM_0325-like [Zerene cesonia]|uniref:uncharacterized oxidoreductase TM_0325-like n=1 Tax=Zerene cesonia TaxID=33412 RepID=UPI0018E55D5D|nr:uncharacterized oxidoreductase TM_0325-like [Zerene cesonia]